MAENRSKGARSQTYSLDGDAGPGQTSNTGQTGLLNLLLK